MPKPQRLYDKNRAPKLLGQPTVAYFHVTGMNTRTFCDLCFLCGISTTPTSHFISWSVQINQIEWKMNVIFFCMLYRITVCISILVLSLDSVNEESMTYVTDIFLAQSWRDPRLRLPSNMREDYRILDVEWLHDIWRPDSFFKNAKKVTFHEMSIPNHYLWLYRDKTLLYMAKYDQQLYYYCVHHAGTFGSIYYYPTHTQTATTTPPSTHSWFTCHANFIPFSIHCSFHLLLLPSLPCVWLPYLPSKINKLILLYERERERGNVCML